MNYEVRSMLEGTYALVAREFEDRETAWDRFIEYIAAENAISLAEQMPGFLGWLFANDTLRKQLPEAYDFKLHSSDYHDHLGDMYSEKMLGKGFGSRPCLNLTSFADADGLAKKLIPETNDGLAILAPGVGTGGLLIAAQRRAPNAYLFGADPDLRALRIALTNFVVFDVDGYLLHADATRQETDIGTPEGRYNWQFANKWDSHMDELKPRVKPPRPPSFSLQN